MKLNSLFCLLLCVLCYRCQAQDDEIAKIKRLLEKESGTWRSGDVKAHADCWYIQPYTRILISTPDGKFIDLPPEYMVSPPPGSIGKGGSSVNDNYKIGIHGNNAWVSHDETSTSREGLKTFTSEIRVLEKINDEWKLVGESIHAYKRN